jgi:hypothetical protein
MNIDVLTKIIIGIILLIIYTISVSACIHEDFSVLPSNKSIQLSNSSDKLVDRHPIDSIPYDIEFRDKYKNAYYYELNNEKYLTFLKNYFKTCMDGLPDFSEVEWVTDLTDTSNINGFYNQSYQYIANRMNKKDIQIVHDVLNRYKIHQNKYMFDIDFILYRNGKINGKHVNMIIFQDYTKTIVMNVSIKGIVGEDKIYMHPVELYQKPNTLYSEDV